MRNKIPFIIMGLLLVLIIVVQMMTPKPVNWSPSYSLHKTTPLGNTILYNELEQVFPNGEITVVEETAYNVLQDSTRVNTNYIFVSNDVSFTEVEKELLFDFVARGNHVFVASGYFRIDSLDFLSNQDAYNIYIRPTYFFQGNDSTSITLSQPEKKTHLTASSRFTNGTIECNPDYYKFLGYRADSSINFVGLAHGNGSLLVNANPNIFSNYGMLDDSLRAYAMQALSILPDQDVFWDERYKPDYFERIDNSRLRYIKKHPGLHMMLWLSILTGLFFLFFRGKREQRVIPIQEPPKNLSLSFVQTIGELYFERSDHTDLSKKQVLYFRDYLSRTFRIRKLEQTKESIDHFLHKTRVEEKLGRRLLNKLFIAEKNQVASELFLLELTSLIEQFKENVKK
ncbi:MAG: DUF4350 domain-containing protein [Saprospiraceae bacterium]|nr:DUF4350 domain-containing protein [Saprospiraceae bacterium]